MKNKVKIILFLITILLIFPFATKEVYAYEAIKYEQKIYCKINKTNYKEDDLDNLKLVSILFLLKPFEIHKMNKSYK